MKIFLNDIYQSVSYTSFIVLKDTLKNYYIHHRTSKDMNPNKGRKTSADSSADAEILTKVSVTVDIINPWCEGVAW